MAQSDGESQPQHFEANQRHGAMEQAQLVQLCDGAAAASAKAAAAGHRKMSGSKTVW